MFLLTILLKFLLRRLLVSLSMLEKITLMTTHTVVDVYTKIAKKKVCLNVQVVVQKWFCKLHIAIQMGLDYYCYFWI